MCDDFVEMENVMENYDVGIMKWDDMGGDDVDDLDEIWEMARAVSTSYGNSIVYFMYYIMMNPRMTSKVSDRDINIAPFLEDKVRRWIADGKKRSVLSDEEIELARGLNNPITDENTMELLRKKFPTAWDVEMFCIDYLFFFLGTMVSFKNILVFDIIYKSIITAGATTPVALGYYLMTGDSSDHVNIINPSGRAAYEFRQALMLKSKAMLDESYGSIMEYMRDAREDVSSLKRQNIGDTEWASIKKDVTKLYNMTNNLIDENDDDDHTNYIDKLLSTIVVTKQIKEQSPEIDDDEIELYGERDE